MIYRFLHRVCSWDLTAVKCCQAFPEFLWSLLENWSSWTLISFGGKRQQQFKPQWICFSFLSSAAKLMVIHTLPIIFLAKLLHNNQLLKCLRIHGVLGWRDLNTFNFHPLLFQNHFDKEYFRRSSLKCFISCLKKKPLQLQTVIYFNMTTVVPKCKTSWSLSSFVNAMVWQSPCSGLKSDIILSVVNIYIIIFVMMSELLNPPKNGQLS